MSLTDPVADMLTRIRNACSAGMVARVDPDLCVSCGICAGSCAPMVVGPPGRSGRDQLAQVRANLDDPESERLAQAFGVPFVINTGFREGSLREAAAELSVPVIVYEAGEALRFEENCIRAGVKGVVRVMRQLEMLAPSSRKTTTSASARA